jgi:hypothetical protein
MLGGDERSEWAGRGAPSVLLLAFYGQPSAAVRRIRGPHREAAGGRWGSETARDLMVTGPGYHVRNAASVGITRLSIERCVRR